MTLDTMIELLTDLRSMVGGQMEIVFHAGNDNTCDRICDVPVSRPVKIIDESTVQLTDDDERDAVDMVVVK